MHTDKVSLGNDFAMMLTDFAKVVKNTFESIKRHACLISGSLIGI